MSTAAVRVVYVRDGRVTWWREQGCSAPDQLEATLDTVLSTVPRSLRGARVTAAIGPARSQLRLVRGLPRLKDRSLLSALVQQDPSRFFLRNGTPLLTTGVEVVEEGVWVGAIDQPAVEALMRVCRRKHWARLDVVPTAAVLHHAFDEDCIEWEDGDVAISVRHEQGRLRSCRRTVGRGGEYRPASERPLAATVPRFDGDAAHFADAIAAARLDCRGTLAVGLRRTRALETVLPSWRIPLAALCVIAAGVLAFVAPGIAAVRASHRLHSELATLDAPARRAMYAERELGERAALLRELTRFDNSSRSTTLSLAALTRAIRAPSMLLNFRADSAGGTIVALTPSAAALVEMLGNDPEVTSPRIVGPVAPQPLPPVPVLNTPAGGGGAPPPTAPPRTERVTIHFLWRGTNR